MKHILLVGNPNCGKTTLFNALTGFNQQVGNWPGVTVEKKTGGFHLNGKFIQITDLPGVYSLSNSESSLDEQIAANAILNLEADAIINVIDGCHLERQLYLTSQLLELGKPIIIALNMMDIAKQRKITIDILKLSQYLNGPVFSIQAHKHIGVDALTQALDTPLTAAKPLFFNLSDTINLELATLEKKIAIRADIDASRAHYLAWRILEGDTRLRDKFDTKDYQRDPDLDILLADARYKTIHELVSETQKKAGDSNENFTARLDRIVLHRFWALPIFLLIMYAMFFFAINVGGAFQDFFDMSSEALFVQGSAWLLSLLHSPNWLVALIANGIGKGINTTLTFIPVIGSMFFFLALLETSGYMARAAFVVDKLMRMLGLPGKSFVPLIIGFGCNVPAIMAARTLETERERLLTILMTPYMSCSARLAIYAVFAASFFSSGGSVVVFSLYMLGILMAVLTGYILRKTSLAGKNSPLILELPAYHRPSLKRLCIEAANRLRFFVFRAGRLIIPVCVILSGLSVLTIDGSISSEAVSNNSILSLFGQWLTPFFSPLGLRQENWPATVGLLTGMLAKEVVIGSLNSLYAQMTHIDTITTTSFNLLHSLQNALWSIPSNFSELGQALLNPFAASASDEKLYHSVYGTMAKCFDGKAGAYAYLLFILLYIPCVSTMAAIRQEANNKLMWFSIIWSFLVAYSAAVLFYQLASFAVHPMQSISWTIIISLVMVTVYFLYKKTYKGEVHALTNP